MNREKAKSFLPLIQALAEGKTIQMLDENNNWTDSLFMNVEYNSPKIYRIKPDPKYRPFNSARECWEEMQKHQPFGWLKPVNKCTNKAKAINISSIECDDEYPIQFTNDYGDYSFEYLYKEFTFMDGTPFGIIEEE